MHREFPGKFESSNLSRDDLGREIGRRLRASSLLLRQRHEGRAAQGAGAERRAGLGRE